VAVKQAQPRVSGAGRKRMDKASRPWRTMSSVLVVLIDCSAANLAPTLRDVIDVQQTRRAALTVIGCPPSNRVLFQFNFERASISLASCFDVDSASAMESSSGGGPYIPG